MKRDEQRLLRRLEIGNLSESLKSTNNVIQRPKPKIKLFDKVDLELVKRKRNSNFFSTVQPSFSRVRNIRKLWLKIIFEH